MRHRLLLLLTALLATACEPSSDLPTSLNGPLAPSYGTVASPYTDLGHQPPEPRSFGGMLAPGGPGANVILNGSFELNDGPGGTGLADWGQYNTGSGAVFVQTGTSSPLSGFAVPTPPDGEFAAMVDQSGPGTHILYQDVTVPSGASLGFDLYLGNRAGAYAPQPTLSTATFPNQQLRVDIMDPSAPIDDTGSGVLANVYRTESGDPLESGYDRIVYDLGAFEGQTVRIRFAEVDNLFFFQVGIDNVVVGREGPSTPDPRGPAEYLIGGFGHIGSGSTIRTFSFNASKYSDGSTEGMFELFSRTADVRLHGDVTCLTIFGSTAWVGGSITTEGPFKGRDAVFRAADLGAGTKGEFEDRLSLLGVRAPGAAQAFCDSTPPTPGLDFGVQGNITISSPGQASFTAVDVTELTGVGVFVPCALDGVGEVVLLDGSLMNLFHFTEDQAGGFHVKTESNPQGVSGVGLASGDSYQGTGSTGSTSMFTISGVPVTDSFVNNFRIIGQGEGNNFLIHVNGHFTVNANGEVTVANVNFSADCR